MNVGVWDLEKFSRLTFCERGGLIEKKRKFPHRGAGWKNLSKNGRLAPKVGASPKGTKRPFSPPQRLAQAYSLWGAYFLRNFLRTGRKV